MLVKQEDQALQAHRNVLKLFSRLKMFSEVSNHRIPSPEDQDNIRTAQACIRDCHLEQLITESKFLRSDSLHELVKVTYDVTISTSELFLNNCILTF